MAHKQFSDLLTLLTEMIDLSVCKEVGYNFETESNVKNDTWKSMLTWVKTAVGNMFGLLTEVTGLLFFCR